MLLTGYSKEIFRPECNPSFQSLHCIAHLDQDVTDALPYLNATLGGFEYFKDPPAVTFRIQGKLITVHPRESAVNALRDEEEVKKILEWMKREINDAWDNRDRIPPSYEEAPKPKIFDILKLLSKTNCNESGQHTCMVFATMVAQGIKGQDDCPRLDQDGRKRLNGYMAQFCLDE